jgi:hypothetical protein
MHQYLPLLALLITCSLQAQTQKTDYQPLATKPPAKVALLAKLEKRYESDLAKLPKENRSELEGIYEGAVRLSDRTDRVGYVFIRAGIQ